MCRIFSVCASDWCSEPSEASVVMIPCSWIFMKAFTPRRQEHEILIPLICFLSLLSLSLFPFSSYSLSLSLSLREAAVEVSDQYHRVLLHVEDHRQICAAGETTSVHFDCKLNFPIRGNLSLQSWKGTNHNNINLISSLMNTRGNAIHEQIWKSAVQ